MKITFDKYIDNPSAGAMVVTNRSMYKTLYTTKFNQVLVRELGKIQYTLYTDDKIGKYYAFLKIPSEVVPEFYYDVVIEFYTDVNARKIGNSLREYYVKFYSNDPAFVYTFAHSFVKNDLFIKDLEPRMSAQAIKHVAKMRNPKDNVWYVKSLYFAYLAMEKYNLFNKAMYKTAKAYNKKELLSSIMQAEEKVKLRQEKGETIEKEKRKKETTKNTGNGRPVINNPAPHAGVVKTSKVSRVSNMSKTVKSTKKTSHT